MMFGFKKNKDILGIDIGDKYMKLSVIKKKKNFYTVHAYNKYDIEPFIKNGKIKEYELIRNVIKEFIAEYKLSNPKVVLSIPNKTHDCSLTRIFEMNKLSKQELDKAMQIEIEDRIPIKDGENFIPSWTVLEEYDKKQKIFLVVANKDVIESYKEIFKDDKLQKLDIIIQSKTITILNNLEDNDDINLIIDIGHTSTDFIISEGQTPLLVRSVNIGGKMLTEMIARFKNISIKEAEELKLRHGCILKGHENLSDNEIEIELSNILSSQIDILLSEIKKTLFIASTELKLDVDNIYITGGTSKLTYLQEYISNKIDKDVQKLIPYYLKDNQDEKLKNNIEFYTTSLPSSFQKYKEPKFDITFNNTQNKNKKNIVIISIIAGTLILVILIGFNIYVINKLNEMKKEIEKYNKQLTELKSQDGKLTHQYETIQNKINEKIQQKEETKRQNDYMKELVSSKIDYVKYLRKIRTIIPTTIQVDEINFDKYNFNIKGKAGTYSDIGYFLKELEYQEEFTDLDFEYKAVDKTIGKYIVRYFDFTITGKIMDEKYLEMQNQIENELMQDNINDFQTITENN